MDNLPNENKPGSVIVTLAASQYTIIAGASTEIAIMLANPGSAGDYFKVNLLGIPQNWIEYSAPPATWVPAGGQERVSLHIHPPASVEGTSGTYLARLHVFSQTDPEQGKELEIQLNLAPEAITPGTLRILSESGEYKAIPGRPIKIPLTIRNLSQQTEALEITIQGVPATWVSLPSPMINISGGEQKSVEIILQVPPAPEIRSGSVPVKVIAARLNDPSIRYEVEIKLRIAAFESLGPVGVVVSSVQFSTAPGGSLAVPITVQNRGLESDAFRLGVEGIPAAWVSTTTPVTPLEPGETKEISLLIRPPISSSSQAGRNKFLILVASQKIPDQIVKVDCLLTIAAFTQFSAELEPKQVNVGQLVSVNVTNQGNTQQVFHLTCESQNDKLLFDLQPPVKPGSLDATTPQNRNATTGNLPRAAQQSHAGLEAQLGDLPTLSISAGESAVFRFSTHPRQRPFFGGAVTYPYQVLVKSQQQQAPPLTGQVISRGMIPIWVLPIVLILCLTVFITAIVAFRDGMQTGTATQTWVANSTQLAGATQTVAANQTAAVIAGQLDTDGDGLTDQYELSINTDPYNPDSDGDRSWDAVEVQVGSNPLIPDTDADGLVDGSESLPCPSPLNPDSDQDGIIDGKDLSPCDANNPALTQTAASLLPTATSVPPTAVPTQTPVVVTPSPTSVSLPRFGGVILFVSDRDGNPEIYNTDDAGHIKRMTDNPAMDIQAAWDPALQRIAFTSNRDGQTEIYIMNADGTNLLNISNNPADDQQPAWSVDGQWVAFSSNRDGNYEIYIIKVSDSEIINLTNNPGNDTQPNWVRSTTFDPLGESIVFTSDRDGNQEIYRMKTDGTETANLTNNSASDQLAKGSPDGALVVFTTNRDGNQEIYTMRIDGATPSNQSNHTSNDFGASWSSTQAWIAFTTDRQANREVYIMKPGNLELYNITNSPYQEQVTDWR